MNDEDTSDIENDDHHESVCLDAWDELFIPVSAHECSAPIRKCPISPMVKSMEDSVTDEPSHLLTESDPNAQMCETRAGVCTPIAQNYTSNEWKGFKIVGDNLDLTIHPRNQAMQNKTKSLHFFHLYEVQERINLSGFSDECVNIGPFAMNLHSLLPSDEDKETLVTHFAVLMARILVKHVPAFAVFSDVVPLYITHKYYAEMSAKSEVLCKCMSVYL